MDCRCPRKLKVCPRTFCPMAVARLRWAEALGREPTEAEEASAPGCQWAVRSHAACFCFFKLMFEADETLTEAQIAHQLGLSDASIKRARESALYKLAQSDVFSEIRESHDDCPLVDERLVDPYEADYQDMSTRHDPVTELLEEPGGEVVDFSEMKKKRTTSKRRP